MKDLMYLLAAAGVGAVAWQMYSQKRKNPDPDDEMASKLEQRLASLNSPNASLTCTATPPSSISKEQFAVLEDRLSRLERQRKNPPPRRRFEEEEFDETYYDD